MPEAAARPACPGEPPTPLSTAGSATARFARLQVPINDFGGVCWGGPAWYFTSSLHRWEGQCWGAQGHAPQPLRHSSRQATPHGRVPCARHCDL